MPRRSIHERMIQVDSRIGYIRLSIDTWAEEFGDSRSIQHLALVRACEQLREQWAVYRNRMEQRPKPKEPHERPQS